MERRVWRQFDWVLLGLVVILTLFGVIMIYSANQNQEDLQDLWWTQLTRAGMGLGIMLFVAAIDYRYYLSFYKFIYGVMVLFLVAIFIAAEVNAGVFRWLNFGLFPVQPSELAKLVVILVSAKIMADHDGEMNRVRNFFVTFLVVAPLIVLVYLQPDLGTTIIMAAIWFIMAMVAGIHLLHVLFLTVSGIFSLPVVWLTMAEYQKERVFLFLNPAADPDKYFNIGQALISIGSGQLLGKGFSIGTQNQLHFLRVRHTDFIFSVIGEELGFVGSMLLIGLIIMLIWRIMRAADMASDPFGRLICVGVAAVIFIQSFINLGVNVGVLPVTGTPLPFVSYGGSALWTFLIAVGLVQSVVMRHRTLDFEDV